MNFISEIKKKNDQLLVSDLKALMVRERELLTKILHHLKEIEVRRLYLVRGFLSLFAMLTQEMGYSESAAGRRIQAMRLLKDIPEVEGKLASGSLSLSVASQIQGFIRNVDQERKEKNIPKLSSEEKKSLVSQVEGTSARQCERKLLALAPERALPREKTKAITEEKTLIQFVADTGLMKKIDKLKELTSHNNPEGKLDQLFAHLVEIGLEKLDPERREARRVKRKEKTNGKNSSPLPTSGVKAQNRHIPQVIHDRVWLRDKGRCQYRDPKTGKICGSKYQVQLDHRYPYALGGKHSPKNLRLLCFKHNQYHADQALEFGLWNKKAKALSIAVGKGTPEDSLFHGCG